MSVIPWGRYRPYLLADLSTINTRERDGLPRFIAAQFGIHASSPYTISDLGPNAPSTIKRTSVFRCSYERDSLHGAFPVMSLYDAQNSSIVYPVMVVDTRTTNNTRPLIVDSHLDPGAHRGGGVGSRSIQSVHLEAGNAERGPRILLTCDYENALVPHDGVVLTLRKGQELAPGYRVKNALLLDADRHIFLTNGTVCSVRQGDVSAILSVTSGFLQAFNRAALETFLRNGLPTL